MRSQLTHIRNDRNGVVLLFTGIILYIVLGFGLGGKFFSVPNFQSMAVQVSSLGMLSIAMSLAMLSGGIDLSIVSIAALSSIAGAYVMSGQWIGVTPGNDLSVTALGVVVVLITATMCGAINGLLIARCSVPPILATLGTMIFFSGVALAITDGQSIAVTARSLAGLSTSTVLDIPVAFVLLLASFVVVGFVLGRRPLGRRIYLLGDSATTLRFTGARNDRVTFSVYTVSGLLSGLAAVLMLASQNAAREGFGESYQLQAILVAVLAGFDPDGGRGRVSNVLIAVAVLQSLQSAFSIMGYSPFAKNLVWGALLLVVMVLNDVSQRERRQRRRRRLITVNRVTG